MVGNTLRKIRTDQNEDEIIQFLSAAGGISEEEVVQRCIRLMGCVLVEIHEDNIVGVVDPDTGKILTEIQLL